MFADASAQGYASTTDLSSVADALEQIVAGDSTYARMLAAMLLAGKHPRDLQDEYPTIRHLVDVGGPESRAIILTTLTAAFGWQVFAEFLTEAVGYENEAAAADDLAAVLRRLTAAEG